jgi:hypothetical protein
MTITDRARVQGQVFRSREFPSGKQRHTVAMWFVSAIRHERALTRPAAVATMRSDESIALRRGLRIPGHGLREDSSN